MVNFFCFEATAACFLCSDPKQLYCQCLAWLYGGAVRCQECSSLLQLIRSGGIVLYRTGASPPPPPVPPPPPSLPPPTPTPPQPPPPEKMVLFSTEEGQV